MKHLLPFLLLLGSTAVFAQTEDYRLFRNGVQYLYGETDTDINFGIRISSICDETYTYMADAYECAAEFPSYFTGPSFAGYEVCQDISATTLSMENGRLVTLHPQASVGQNWVATIENTSVILAVVDSVRLESVLGLTDSIKYVSFHVGTRDQPTLNSIRIGKTLGLVSALHFWELTACPEQFVLRGISEPEVGLQYQPTTFFLRPDERQEIHFEEKYFAGDDYYYAGDSSYFQYHEYQLQLENWTIAPGGDSISCRYRGARLSYRIDNLGNRTPYDSVLVNDYVFNSTISHAEYQALSRQPGSVVPLFSSGQQQPEPDENVVTRLYFTARNCFGKKRSFGRYYYRETNGLAQAFSDGFPGNAYFKGVSIPFYRSGNFEVSKSRKLTYLKDDTRECGIPYDFTGIVATPVSADAPPLENTIGLFPNPANEVTTLWLPSGNSYEVIITGINGPLVRNYQDVNGDLTLDVKRFTAGVYTVTVMRDGFIVERRRLVVR